jgi:hypothetical protein
MPRTFTYTTEVFDEYTDFPQTGDVDTIYIDASKNIAYRYDDSYYTISSAEVDIWGAMGSLSKGGGGGGGASWGSINGTLSNQTDLNTALSAKQNSLTLTTTGTSGAATLNSGTLNIPQYSGGFQGLHALLPLASGRSTYAGTTSQGLASAGIVANRLFAVPFIPNQNITTSALYMNAAGSIASGLARILIYSDLNGLPNTKLYESANLDGSTTGIKTATTTFNFVAGTTYWLCLYVNLSFSVSQINTSGLIPLNINGVANPNTHVYVPATFGSAPTTFGTPVITNGNVPFIGVTKA